MLKNRNLVIAVVVVIIIIAAGIGWFVMNKDDSTSTNSSSKTSASGKPAENGSSTTKGSLSSLAGGKKAQECTTNYSGASGTSTGTMYSDGKGQARMQTSIQTERGNTGETNQIIKDNKAYSWTVSDGQGFGVVIDLSKTNSAQSQAQGQSSSSSSSGPAPTQNFDIKCKDWQVDESKFVLPTNITFRDLSSLQNPIPTTAR